MDLDAVVNPECFCSKPVYRVHGSGASPMFSVIFEEEDPIYGTDLRNLFFPFYFMAD